MKAKVLVAALLVSLSAARYVDFEDSGLIQLADYFECAQLDSHSVVCPDSARICKCPSGHYGQLSMDHSTKKWGGVCSPCPKAHWSAAGATSIDECVAVACPPNASGYPICKCNKQSSGQLHWMPCTGKWDGECIRVEQGPLAPPTTTILEKPPRIAPYSSVTFFFQASSENAIFNCTMDNHTAPCFPPSVTYEQLRQGPHFFSVAAVDERGQPELNPQIYRFEVKVPCPAHAHTSGAPKYSCFCDPAFYSESGAEFPYTSGAYYGECSACQPCAPSAHRTGCGADSPGVCTPCNSGTFKSQGLSSSWNTSCASCQPCESGHFLVGCGGNSNGACQRCPAGTFKPDVESWDSTCSQCDACPAGEVRVGCGDTEPGTCEPCPTETYKDTEGSWETRCLPFPSCRAGYERFNISATSSGICQACPVHTYKTKGEEHEYTERCIPCVACQLNDSGYRAGCGGHLGPGTCEICAECVGTPFDTCFCDVPAPEPAPTPSADLSCINDEMLLEGLREETCAEAVEASHCTDMVVGQLCPEACDMCDTAGLDNDVAMAEVLAIECPRGTNCTCQGLYESSGLCQIDNPSRLGRIMYSFCPETCATWKAVYLNSDLTFIAAAARVAFSSMIEGERKDPHLAEIGVCTAHDLKKPSIEKLNSFKELETISAKYITHLLQSPDATTVPTISSTPEKHMFVNFFAPSCPHCKALAPTWKTLQTQAPAQVGDIEVGAIDCESNMDVCDTFGVVGFPTIAHFPKGLPMGAVVASREFVGERTKEEILEWMKISTKA